MKMCMQLDYGGADGDEDQRGHHEEDERDDHFYGGLGGLFFGALAAFGAQGIGVDAQGLSDAGSEAIGLNQGADQGADVVDAGALGEIAQSFDARLAGAGFEIEEMEFGAQFGMRVAEVVADAHHGLIERQSGFDADYGEIECVGKAEADAALAFGCIFRLSRNRGSEKAESGEADEQKRRIESGEEEDGDEADGGAEDAQAAVDGDVLRVAVSGLNEPGAGLRNVGGGDAAGRG